MKILLIEDDKTIARNIQILLQAEHYIVEIAATGEEGSDKALMNEYDLIILDWMLPDTDGPTLCTKLREEEIKTPVLMLTARTQLEDKLHGFAVGADDYLGKPFVREELLARVKALLRRAYPENRHPKIAVADLEVDTTRHAVTRAGKTILLSPKEYALLEYLAVNQGKALDRMTILTHVWDENTDLFTNTVDVHIRYLRKKIDDGHKEKLIRTVKGTGYMLCEK